MNTPARHPVKSPVKSTILDLDLTRISVVRRAIGVVALLLPAAVLAWLILSLFQVVPTMTTLVGTEGLRFPAGIAIGGLLVAALAFWTH